MTLFDVLAISVGYTVGYFLFYYLVYYLTYMTLWFAKKISAKRKQQNNK